VNLTRLISFRQSGKERENGRKQRKEEGETLSLRERYKRKGRMGYRKEAIRKDWST
jgi:hypothetical protein